MVINKTRFFVLLCLVQTLFLSAQEEHEGLGEEIDKIITYDSYFDQELTPGFIITVIEGNTTSFFPYGTKNKEKSDSLSSTDVFEIGSCSKPFTAIAILDAIEKGKLNLFDKVNNYLPVSFRNPDLSELTVEDLLLHRYPFPKRPSNFGLKEKEANNPYKYYAKEDLLSYYCNQSTLKIEGKASYSHVNYALLEIILEQVYQNSFDRIMDEEIFAPTGMELSFINSTTKDITLGYNKNGYKSTPWKFSSFGGSEGIKTSSKDLASFFEHLFHNEEWELNEAIKDMLSKKIESIYNDQFYTGYGWQVINQKKAFDIYAMTGATDGHSAFIAFVPETETAVIILSNSFNGTKDLGMSILRLINYNWKRKDPN
jgi:CubicO group peptidase (beta-lactamase class C family)